jgi:serine/threonine protein kinase
MSPEQGTGDRELDGRSDIYSLGAVAYYLLTGRPPSDGQGGITVMIAHARDPVVPPSRVRADIPEELDRVVLLFRDVREVLESRWEIRQRLWIVLVSIGCGLIGPLALFPPQSCRTGTRRLHSGGKRVHSLRHRPAPPSSPRKQTREPAMKPWKQTRSAC